METPDDLREWHRLIKKGQLALIRKFVADGADVNARSRFGWTPLMLAANEGNSAVIEYLLAQGTDVNAVNDAGASALSYAALQAECSSMQVLLAANASVNVRPHGVSLMEFAEKWGGCPGTHRHLEILRNAGAA